MTAQAQLREPLVEVACGVCGSHDATEIASGHDYEYETTETRFYVQRCRACQHVYLSPRPSVDDLPTIYPANYYSYGMIERMNPLALRAKKLLDHHKIDSWLREAGVQTPRFLDVGCGEGWFLQLLSERGVPREQLWGIELDERSIAALQQQGYQARCGTIERADLPAASFDLIVSLQVIEHVADPRAVLARMAELLAPGGAIILETPNFDSLDRRLFEKQYWGGYHFPRHWSFFTEQSIKQLVAPLGLQIDSVSYLPAPTFWLYSLHHFVKYELGLSRTARWLDPMRNLPLTAAAILLDRLRAFQGGATSNMQLVLRRESVRA